MMIPIPQTEENDIEENMFLEPEKKEMPAKSKTIFKSLLFIIIIIILIVSYNIQKKTNNENNKEIISQNKNEQENQKIKDTQNEDNIDINKNINKNKQKPQEIIKSDVNTDIIYKSDKSTTNVENTDNTDNNEIVKNELDLTIIINNFNKNNDINSIVKNIVETNIENCEIIITSNYIFDNKEIKSQEKELKNKKILIEFIEYNEKTNRLKMKLDSASKSNGKYIAFIDPEEMLSLDVFKDFKNIIKDNIDIIHYDLDYDRLGNKRVVYQPQLYESLFFGGRDSFDFTHFHVIGKLYKKEIFLEGVKNLDKLYLDQSDKYFDEIMILILVFQKANSFIKIKQSKSCNRNRCQINQYRRYNMNPETLKDSILFIRFLFEYTGKDKVQEKRFAAKIFNDLFISRGIRTFYNDELLKLMEDTINLYLNSELINDMDKNPIKNYRNGIRK